MCSNTDDTNKFTVNDESNDYKYAFVTQKDIQYVELYDYEWDSITTNIQDTYKKVSTWSIGNYLDGVFATLFLPFGITLYKLIKDPNNLDIKDECLFYLNILIVFFGLILVKKIFKFKFLSTYKDCENDLKNIVKRIAEINNRLKIPPKEKEKGFWKSLIDLLFPTSK